MLCAVDLTVYEWNKSLIDQVLCERVTMSMMCFFFFFNDTATTEIYTLSLHDALPICFGTCASCQRVAYRRAILRIFWPCRVCWRAAAAESGRAHV